MRPQLFYLNTKMVMRQGFMVYFGGGRKTRFYCILRYRWKIFEGPFRSFKTPWNTGCSTDLEMAQNFQRKWLLGRAHRIWKKADILWNRLKNPYTFEDFEKARELQVGNAG